MSFFDTVRPLFSGKLTQSQVDGLNIILDAVRGLPISYQAYILATVYHETARTMQPIAEYGKGKGKPYGKPGKYGQSQYGRGYVQLTWDANYEKADKALGLNGALLRDFDLAMRPDIAAKILVRGCVEGWFTGKKLGDYLPSDYFGARRVVNGLDRAEPISGYADTFELALLQPATPVDHDLTDVDLTADKAKPVAIATGIAAVFAGLWQWGADIWDKVLAWVS